MTNTPYSRHRRATRAPPSAAATLPWWLLYIGFVVYGSLVPLNFQPLPWDQAWEMFRHIRLLDVGTQGRADWVANGVLYVPVGFLGVATLARFRTPLALGLALLAALLVSFSLAVAVEFTQLFFPPRTVSLNDISAEFIGSLLGAVFAARWSDRFRSLLATLTGAPERLLARLLKAYALGYLAFSLFPYDFLVSPAEVEMKWHSGGWGWFIASESMHGGFTLIFAKLCAEALAVVPLGWMLCQTRGTRRPCPSGQTLFAGAALGLMIEMAQFFIVSGISQGLSILTRAAGMYLGARLWHRRTDLNTLRLASSIRRFALPMGLLYLLALAAVHGWFGHRWLGVDAAMDTLDTLHFLPFYYHYYTTEQAALLSFTSVYLMYAPLGLLAWATLASPGLALWLALAVAGGMETSKLFLAGLHPDPTNLIIAAFAAWATAKLAKRLASAPTMATEDAPRPIMPPAATAPLRRHRSHGRATAAYGHEGLAAAAAAALPPAKLERPSWIGYAALIACLTAVGRGVATFPGQPALLGLLLAGQAALVWYRPQLLLVVVPAALALFDLAPWSGRFFFDEFDLLLLTSVVVVYVRLPSSPRQTKGDKPFLALAALLGLSYAIAAARGLWPWPLPEADAFSHYYSPYNALRIAKGAMWAFLLYGLIGRMASAGHAVRRLFAQGLVIGLAGTVAVIVWERFAFPGLFNFTAVYRVTGPFSQMHIGGADIETYLTLSAPFLVLLLFEKHKWTTRLIGTALLVGATYGVMVTFSRLGYAAYAIALALALGLATAPAGNLHRRPSQRGLAAAALAALALAVALPILKGPFTQARLAQTGGDLGIRLAHWSDALRLRDPGWSTALFGMGLGRYPETHYWRSSENRAATYRLAAEGDNTYLRLGYGSPLYLEQFVTIRPQRSYALSLNARSAQAGAHVTVSLCEKWLLTSARCVFKSIVITEGGRWQPLHVLLSSADVGSGPWYRARPVKLSLFTASAQVAVDVDDLRLRDAAGDDLLRNGDFAQGLDRWFFSVDNDRPWHIWSLPIQVLFDQGWLGVIALALIVALAIWRSAGAAWRGDTLAGALLAASLGFLAISSLDSLVDSPRLLLLFLLLIGLGARAGTDIRAQGQGRG